MKTLLIITIIICITLNCGGGFGADCENAKNLGPGIFGGDST